VEELKKIYRFGNFLKNPNWENIFFFYPLFCKLGKLDTLWKGGVTLFPIFSSNWESVSILKEIPPKKGKIEGTFLKKREKNWNFSQKWKG
jgi:hypothetical protein